MAECIKADDSILNTIKQMFGLAADYHAFDAELIIHINSAIATLYQIGVGAEAYKITCECDTWEEYIGGYDDIDSVKTYIFLKIKPLFDPPANSFVLNAMNDQLKELEWRLNVACDTVREDEEKESEW